MESSAAQNSKSSDTSQQQGTESPCDTLRILHLPSYLSHSQRERLLKKYGAIKVKTVNKSEKYAITFAKFQSENAATQAFLRLHQLQVRGRRLSVEYAKKNTSELFEHDYHQPENPKEQSAKEETIEPNFQTFLRKLNSWAFSQVLTQPPPPNIWYKYSPPTTNTLLRICIQMLKEPVFYCQVLHLMNKMNLPPPFQELEPEFPFLKDIYDMERYRDVLGLSVSSSKENDENLEEDEESELETDDDSASQPKEIIPLKRKLGQSSKRLKIPKFVNPSKQAVNASSSSQKLVKPEDVFESLHRGESKSLKIALKVDLDLEKRLDVDHAGSTAFAAPQEEGGFGLIYPVKRPVSDAKSEETTSHPPPEFITSEELAANRLSVNDQRLLPVFKHYHPGKPSCRLYIKNLSKQVELKDLDFIYKKYKLPDREEEDPSTRYNIRLMQEGRMKGQAFITLQTVEQAQTALEETNGYILKDKPMVVQFAKIASKSQAPENS